MTAQPRTVPATPQHRRQPAETAPTVPHGAPSAAPPFGRGRWRRTAPLALSLLVAAAILDAAPAAAQPQPTGHVVFRWSQRLDDIQESFNIHQANHGVYGVKIVSDNRNPKGIVTIRWRVSSNPNDHEHTAQPEDFGASGNFPTGTVVYNPSDFEPQEPQEPKKPKELLISVPIVQDSLVEFNEQYRVTLSVENDEERVRFQWGRNTWDTTITDDDGELEIFGPDPNAVHEGDRPVFTISLGDGRASGVGKIRVDYEISDISDIDVSSLGLRTVDGRDNVGFVSIENGKSSATLTLPVIDDVLSEPREGEPRETVTVTLLPTKRHLGLVDISPTKGSASVTILPSDNNHIVLKQVAAETAPAACKDAAALDPGTVAEGATALYCVSLRGDRLTGTPQTRGVRLLWQTVAAETNPAEPADLQNRRGTLVFDKEKTWRTFAIETTQDDEVEGDEPYRVTVGLPAGSARDITAVSADTTIVDDDTAISIAGPTNLVKEGENAIFTVTRKGAFRGVLTVHYSVTSNDSDAEPAEGDDLAEDKDFEDPQKGTLTIPADKDSAEIILPITDDDDAEGDERLPVTLVRGTPPAGQSGSVTIPAGERTATAIIAGSDRTHVDLRQVDLNAAGDRTVREGRIAKYRVTLTGDAPSPGKSVEVTLKVSGTGQRAAVGADFVGGSFPEGTLTFNDVGAPQPFPVATAQDDALEGDEQFAVTASTKASNVVTKTASATTTLRDDDAEIAIFGPQQIVREGGKAVFTVTYRKAPAVPNGPVTVTYSIGGTATAGDFEDPRNGSLTLPAGRVGARIRLPIVDDVEPEPEESLIVTLTGATLPPRSSGAATIASGRGSATATIAASDPTSLLLRQIVGGTGPDRDTETDTVAEGGIATYRATLVDGLPNLPLSVTWRAHGTGAANSADNEDFPGATFPPQSTLQGRFELSTENPTRTFSFAIADDERAEDDEPFHVTATSTPISNQPGTPPSPNPLPLAARSASVTTTITANDQTVTVSVQGPDAPVTEGDDAVFTVKATGMTTVEITGLTYTLTADTATAGDDYDVAGAMPRSPLRIPAGTDQEVKIRVPTVDDMELEAALETFALQLGGTLAGGGTGVTLQLDPATATGTIEDNEVGVSISGPATIAEGDPAEYTVTVARDIPEDVTVTYDVEATATAGAQPEDLSNGEDPPGPRSSFPRAASRVITPGPSGTNRSTTISLPILADGIGEGTESFVVTLTAVSGGGTDLNPVLVTDPSVTTTIAASDAVILSVADAAKVTEGDDAVFTVKATGMTTVEITGLTYTLTADTATAGDDYDVAGAMPRSPLRIPAGTDQEVKIRVPTVDDMELEAALETFALQLGGTLAGGGTGVTLQLDPATATGTIEDNEVGVSISGPATIAEGDPAEYTVTVARDIPEDVTVTYDVEATATAGAQPEDLSNGEDPPGPRSSFPRAASRVITPGPSGTNRSTTISLPILADGIGEGTESFVVTLTAVSGGGTDLNPVLVTDPSVTTTIAASDAVILSVADAAKVTEGDDAVFTVKATGMTTVEITGLTYTLTADTATAGDDYDVAGAMPRSPLRIPAGTDQEVKIRVPTVDDMELEAALETFALQLGGTLAGGGTGVTLQLDPATATGTIEDNEVGVSISGPATIAEGDPAEYTVTVARDIPEDVTVTYDVEATATAGAQPEDLSNGEDPPGPRSSFPRAASRVITPGPSGTNRSTTISLPILADGIGEGTESFVVTLTAVSGGGTDLNPVLVTDPSVTTTIAASDAVILSVADAAKVTEGDDAVFTVKATGMTTVEITGLTYTLTADTATAGDDYDVAGAMPRSPLRIPAGTDQEVKIRVPTVDDMELEAALETFALQLGGTLAGGGTGVTLQLDPATATGTIEDNEVGVSISGPATIAEGDPAEYTVTVARDIPEDVTVTYDVEATATAGAQPEDLSNGEDPPGPRSSFPRAASRVITPGPSGTNRSTTISLPILADGIGEGTESFVVTLTAVSGGGTNLNPVLVTDPSVTTTIAASDAVILSVADAAKVTEGDDAVFTVKATGMTTVEITGLTYTLIADTATAGDDYDVAGAMPRSPLRIPAGTDQEVKIRVPTVDDMELEAALETFALQLGGTLAGGGTGVTFQLDPATATGTIEDNEVGVSISGPATIAEGDPAEYTVTVARDIPEDVTVTYDVEATATAGAQPEDLSNGEDPPGPRSSFPRAASRVITPGPSGTNRSTTISLPILADGIGEGTESFVVTLTAVSGGGTDLNPVLVTDPSVTTTIAASDAVILSVADAAKVTEGDDAVFTVKATGMTTVEITGLTYTLTADTATAGDDYDVAGAMPRSPLRIPAGTDQEVKIRVPTVDDMELEAALETFALQLGGTLAGGGTGVTLQLDPATATGTIEDNEVGVSISGPATIAEGDPAEYTVTVARDIPEDVTVTYDVEATATAGAQPEDLSNGEDPPGPRSSFPRAASRVITPGPSGTNRSTTISLPILADGIGEGTESFVVTLTAVSGGGTDLNPVLVTDPSVTTTIAASDAVILSVADAAKVTEGDDAVFTVKATGMTTVEITGLTYTLTADTATAGDDYDVAGAMPRSPLRIPAGTDQEVKIRVPTVDDMELEAALETFALQLGGTLAGGGTGVTLQLDPATATGTIEDNEVGVSISGPATIAEGDPAEYTVTVARDIPEDVTVTYDVEATATAGAQPEDLSNGEDPPGPRSSFPRAASRVITPGPSGTNRSTTISLPILADGIGEGTESFVVTLTAVSGGGTNLNPVLVTDPSVTTTIAASDAVILSVADAAKVTEGDDAVFTVKATGMTTVEITGLTYTLTADTATAGDDYDVAGAMPRSPLRIPAGTDQEVKIRVPTVDDMELEAALETFALQLGGTLAGGGTGVTFQLDPATATGTIEDNEVGVSISGPATIAEGDPAEYTVTVARDIPEDVTVTYDVEATATAGAQPEDLSNGEDPPGPRSSFPRAASRVITPGPSGTNRSTTISLPILADGIGEGTESFVVTLTAVSGGGTDLNPVLVTDPSVTTTIAASDAVILSVADAAKVTEGDDAVFTVKATGMTTVEITGLTYTLTADTATAGDDYDVAGATPRSPLTIPAGTDRTVRIRVPTVDDRELEAAQETFSLQLGGTLAGGGTGVTLQLDPARATATGTIADNEVGVSISGPATIAEGEPAEYTVTVARNIPEDVTVTYDVEATATAGAQPEDLSNGEDPPGPRSSFPSAAPRVIDPGPARTNRSTTISLPILADGIGEGTESFVVTLTAVSGGGTNLNPVLVTDPSVTTTIAASDAVILSVADAAEVTEGTAAEFTVTATGMTAVEITGLTYTLIAGTATAVDDYDVAGATPRSPLTIPAGTDRTVRIRVPTVDDRELEAAQETFSLQLGGTLAGGGTGVTLQLDPARATATGTIADNEVGVSISGPATIAEGEPAEYTVTVARNIAADVTVIYDVEATATAGAQPEDLSNGEDPPGPRSSFPSAAPRVIDPGPARTNRSTTISLPILADGIGEGTESFVVTLTAVSGGGTNLNPVLVTDPSVTTTIAASDAVILSVADAAEVTEGTAAEFTVTATGMTAVEITGLTYTLIAGTATAVDDYDVAGATPRSPLTIPAGTDRTVRIRVPTVDDRELEAAQETFSLQLGGTLAGGGTGVTLQLDPARATATGTIADNEVGVSISGPATIAEGEPAEYTVTVARNIPEDVTVTYDVEATATAGAQPEDLSNGEDPPGPRSSFPRAASRVITPGPSGTNRSTTISLPILADGIGEGTESFVVTLTAVSGGGTDLNPVLVTDPSVTTTIAASDPIVRDETATVSIAGPGAPVAEGSPAVFTVTVAGTATTPVLFHYAVGTRDGAVSPAVAGDLGNDDNSAALEAFPRSASPLSVAVGKSEPITVPIFDDPDSEPEETFMVTLSLPAGGNPGVTMNLGRASAPATIAASDQTEVRVSQAELSQAGERTVPEGAEITYSVVLTGDAPNPPVSVTWSVGGTGPQAAEKEDFEGGAFPATAARGALTFSAVGVPQTFSFTIAQDDELEGDEQFTVTIRTEAPNVVAGTDSVTTTILDDDTVVSIRPPARPAPEGTTAIFRVERSGQSVGKMTMRYSISGVDASDYIDQNRGVLLMAEGELEKPLPIFIANDGVEEDEERLRVTMGSAVPEEGGSVVLRPRNAAVTILAPLQVTARLAGPEKALEGQLALFEVSLEVTPAGFTTQEEVVLVYSVGGSDSGDTAERGLDYASPPEGELRIAAGVQRGEFAIPILLDGVLEGEETMSVLLLEERSAAGHAELQVAEPPRVRTLIIDVSDEGRRERRVRALLAVVDRATAQLATDSITARFEGGFRGGDPISPCDLDPERERRPGEEHPPASGCDIEAEQDGGPGGARPLAMRVYPGSAQGAQAPTATPRAGGVFLQLAGREVLTPGGAPAITTDPGLAGSGDGLGAASLNPASGASPPLGAVPVELVSEEEAETVRFRPAELPSFAQLLGGTRFEFHGDGGDWGRLGEGVTVWGSGGYADLEGDPSLGGHRLEYDGESYGFFVGADKRLPIGRGNRGSELLAGAAVGWTRGDLNFRDHAANPALLEGRFELAQITAHPYAAWRFSPQTQAWLVFGYGAGTVEITESETPPGGKTVEREVKTDTWMWMASAGFEGLLQLPSLGETTQLALRLAATRTVGELDRARFDDGSLLRGTKARTWRVTGEAEGSHSLELPGGGLLRPFVTARLRGDGGDDLDRNWELAFDLGGGADLSWREWGLELGVEGTTQINRGISHRKHRVVLEMSYDFDADARGLKVGVESSLDAEATGLGGVGGGFGATGGNPYQPGSGVLQGLDLRPGDWAGRNAGTRRNLTLRRNLRGEIGYGLATRPFGFAGLLTPYARFRLGDGGHSYATGLRFEGAGGASLGIEGVVDRDAGRAATTEEQVDYQLRVTGEMPF